MKRDHETSTIGPWAAQKLDALEAYLRAYNTALKYKPSADNPFERIYIDAFAGSPRSKIRGSGDPVEPSPFLDDTEVSKAQEQFILGSPMRALQVEPRFHRYYFFDLDKSRAESLGQICASSKGVEVEVGDCNPRVCELARTTLSARNVRGVAFLDPYGPHLEWETLRALAATGTMEAIINFPVAMAINRLIIKSGDVPEKWRDMLNKCFGTEEWNKLAYNVNKDLFGEEVVSKKAGVADLLLDLYMSRLRSIFPHVSSPRLIRNTKGAPLYYLIWAGPHPLGLRIAEYILKQGEKV